MAGDELIGAYRSELGHRLPPDVLDELLDGLVETRNFLLEHGSPPEHATTAAIGEFGQPDAVLAAFTRDAPDRQPDRVPAPPDPCSPSCGERR